jgi:transcriptional regulator with XRE-family HTH domain
MLEQSELVFTRHDGGTKITLGTGVWEMESAESPDGIKLGEYIKRQRETLGISQRQLAGRIELHHSYLARLEAGDYAQPAPAVLHRIAEALDLEPEDLFALAGHTVPRNLPSFAPYLRAKYDISDQAARELSDYFRYLSERYNIRERQPNSTTDEDSTH